MKIAIVGSRHFSRPDLVARFVKTLDTSNEIWSGGAKGVDAWAVEVAKERGMVTEELFADWETLGRRAGPERNTQLVETVDAVVAFWDGSSRGTKDTIRKAKKAGKLFAVFTIQG